MFKKFFVSSIFITLTLGSVLVIAQDEIKPEPIPADLSEDDSEGSDASILPYDGEPVEIEIMPYDGEDADVETLPNKGDKEVPVVEEGEDIMVITGEGTTEDGKVVNVEREVDENELYEASVELDNDISNPFLISFQAFAFAFVSIVAIMFVFIKVMGLKRK